MEGFFDPGDFDGRGELHVGGNPRFSPTRRVVGPRLRKIQCEIYRNLLRPCHHREADADLTVCDLAGRARVLPLNSDRVGALLQETCVVDDPRIDGLLGRHGGERVLRRRQANIVVAPWRIVREMKKPLMLCIGTGRIRACPGSDRFDALALAVTEDPFGVERERFAPALSPQHLADAVEELRQSPLSSNIHQIRHGSL